MKLRVPLILILALGLQITQFGTAYAQNVLVTATLDTNRIAVGATTVLRVWGQVIPARQADADRIFSFHLDLENLDPAHATLDAAQLQRPFADQDAFFSSSGILSDGQVRGIFDTFLNRAGAGVSNRVELFNIPVRGTAAGTARFLARPGSGSTTLAADFLVAPRLPGSPWTGGDYTGAAATLEVTGSAAPVVLGIGAETLPDGRRRISLAFNVPPGRQPVVEFSATASPAGPWQALPGAPHLSGQVTDTPADPKRFYRVRLQ